MNRLLIFALLLFTTIEVYSSNKDVNITDKYADIADRIIKSATNDTNAYYRLGFMCDVFGPRLSGSKNLENTILWMLDEMKKDGIENVRADEVMVPHWVRKYEKCVMVSPRNADIPVFALGGSIGTQKGGITAEVIVVKDFDELELRREEIKGKIVVYNFDYEGYGHGVQYRFYGASRAAKYGAVASLIRSVSPNEMRNLHTGMMVYEDSLPKIPHAAISPEDAKLLSRLCQYGITPTIRLELDVETLSDILSHNVIGEYYGSELPDEIIAIGGHSDSWDAGTGAHDNAGGCIVTWEAVKLLKKLGLKPRRTVRIVQWTNEENGVKGGNAYRDKHQNEKHVLMFEHDSGIFMPSALRYTGPDSIYSLLNQFIPLLAKINPEITLKNGGGGVDINPLMKTGVPGMSISTDDKGKYFFYHHNHSDTFDKINKEELNNCIAAIAIIIYIYADLPINLLNNVKE
jgi:carboxypeptidase Q